MSSMFTRATLIVAILSLTAGQSFAAIIVNDTWRDGTDSDPASPIYAENNGAVGIDADLDGDLESVWFQGGDGTLDPVGAGGPLRGQFSSSTSTSSATWTTYFTPEATPVTLANAGDKLTVRWAFSLTNVNASNTSQNFRLAVVDSPSASRLAANGSPGSSTYQGYGMFMNMAGTLGNSNPFQLREHDGDGALLSGSGDWIALGNGATTGNTGYAEGTTYSYVMEITRTDTDGLDIVSTMTGGSLNNSGTATVSFTDTTPGTFSFDTFAVRPSGATTTAEIFNTSLFQVEVSLIPEPTSLALFLLGGLAMFVRRR